MNNTTTTKTLKHHSKQSQSMPLTEGPQDTVCIICIFKKSVLFVLIQVAVDIVYVRPS